MSKPKAKSASSSSAQEPAKSVGKSLADFRAEHDKSYIIPRRIRDGLTKLGAGWEYELGFMRIAGLSTTDLAAYRDEFAEHVVVVGGRNPKRIWVGSKDLAVQMRQMVA